MRGASVRKFSGVVRIAAIASISIAALFFGACQMSAPLIEPVAKSLEDARCCPPDTNPPTDPPASPALLGSAADFVVLGATTVTNAGSSVFTGNVGVYPGTALTGFQPEPFNTIVFGPGGTVTYLADGGLVNGTIYAGGVVGSIVEQAHADAVLAYNYLQAQTPDTIYAGVTQLDGLTFTPGVYRFDPSANLQVGGTVYLDFQGNSDAVFIFQMGSTLVTMLDSKVLALNPGSDATCSGANVYWAVGSSATIDSAEFIGTVIAWTTITQTSAANTPASTLVSGRFFALNGAVTMSTATIAICAGSGGGTNPPDPDPECKPYKDFVTGGGWIDTGSGSWHHKRDKATFGVSGGIKNGKFWGQLSFNDHDGVRVKSIKVTAYKVIDSVTRQIEGIAKVNGHGSFTYVVVVADKGERGRNDTFSMVLSNGYSISGTLDGGNIQLHTKYNWGKDDHRKDLDLDLEAEDYVDPDEQEGISNSDL